MATPKTIVSTVGFTDPSGTLVANGHLTFTLSQPAEVASGGGLVDTAPISTTLTALAVIPPAFTLWAEDQLNPTGTTYRMKLTDSNNNLVGDFGQIILVGSSPIDISQLIPTSSSGGTVSYPAPVLLAPAGDQIIVQPSGTNLKVNRFAQIRFADQFSGADGGAKINAADADLGSTPGEIWVNNDAGTNWSTAVTISANHVLRFIQGGTYTSSASPMITLAGTGGAGGGAAVIGTGISTILQTSSGTADIIQMTGNACYAANLLLRSSVTRTAGAGINCKGGAAYFENMEFNPVWNGVQCNTSSCGISGKNFVMRQGAASAGAWNAGLNLGGMTSGAVCADLFFSQGQIADSASFGYGDAAIVLDAGLDTIRFTDVDAGSILKPGLKLRFSGGSLDVPRLVRFTSCSWECGSTAPQVVEATAYKDVRFLGCVFNSAVVGLHVNGSTSGNNITIQNSMFNQQQNQAVLVDSGSDTNILNSTISGASQSGNGSFDAVRVSANVNAFHIDGNNFSDLFTFSNHPNFDVRVAAGTSTSYTITNNVAGTTVTAFLSDGGTGLNKTTFPNVSGTGAMYIPSAGTMQMAFNGVAAALFANALTRQPVAGMHGWSPNADASTAISDTNITRSAAGVLQIGTGETANSSGTLKLTAVQGPGFQKQVFTGNGTFTIGTGITQVKATVVGAGGAGGGASAAALGTGGGSGGSAVKYLTGLTPGNTIAVTVGTGGTGSSAGNGGAGNNSLIASGTQTITTVTAFGGSGGIVTGNDIGGAGGVVSTNGDLNFTGTPGEAAATANVVGGNGGASIFGGGGLGALGSAAGAAGVNAGSGGGGAGLGANNAGGAGANGLVVFEWVS